MYTLFISTFDKYINIGLFKEDKLIKSLEQESLQSHSIYVMPMIESILKEINIKPNDLNQIEVINGPGSFTGVRIGVTIAKTFAYTLNIPIKTISSLEAFALSEPNIKLITTLKDVKGIYFGVFNELKELEYPLNYLSKEEFTNYLEDNNLSNYKIIDEPNLNLLKIHNYLKNRSSVNPHRVNPLYIKKIEVEKC